MKSRLIEWHDSIGSTMTRAAELARHGAVAGTTVAAHEQTAGQGRLGRQWYSPPRTGLYFTQILRPDLPPAELPVVTLALGVAVADALQVFACLAVDLRWPNDVLTFDSGKKLAGILTQLDDGAVLAGIGLNVAQPDFPEELRPIATSLLIETGTEYDREFLLRAIAGSIDTHVRTLKTMGAGAILRLFAAASSYVEGCRVSVDLPNGPVIGTTAGLTPSGFLRLQTDSGEIITITAGGVRPL
jgi:BirA family biotin operon repressor/biotin-[acetyl-CoA-carboxylase] ligase